MQHKIVMAVALWMSAACIATSESGQSENDTTSEKHGGTIDCGNVDTELALDEKKTFKFSAEDILSFTEEPFSAPLVWEDQAGIAVALPNTEAPEEVRVEITRRGDTAIDHASAHCSAALEIPVSLHVSASQGSFELDKPVAMSTVTADAANIVLELDPKELLPLHFTPNAKGWEVVLVTLRIAYKNKQPTGDLTVKAVRKEGGTATTEVERSLAGGNVKVASW